MKVIDLLNKIANGEEVPKKIKYLNYEYEFNEEEKEYQRLQNEIIYGLGEDRRLDIILDEEVKIIEEPQEHKIPEKLKIEQDTPNSNFYIRNEYGTKCALTKHSKIIADKINEIIDYLEEIE